MERQRPNDNPTHIKRKKCHNPGEGRICKSSWSLTPLLVGDGTWVGVLLLQVITQNIKMMRFMCLCIYIFIPVYKWWDACRRFISSHDPHITTPIKAIDCRREKNKNNEEIKRGPFLHISTLKLMILLCGGAFYIYITLVPRSDLTFRAV